MRFLKTRSKIGNAGVATPPPKLPRTGDRGKDGPPPPVPDGRPAKKGELLATPVRPVRVTPSLRVDDLVAQMAGMSLQARNIGACARVLEKMLTDPERPTIFLGLAGPLIAAGLRGVLRDLVVGNVVDVVVSTGAILYQDIYQARGYRHYQGSPEADDVALRRLRINRIYDTYVDEDKFWETDRWCGRIADGLPPGPHSSRDFLEALGNNLDDPESVVHQCSRRGVPVFSPALNDSSIGIGLTEHHHRRAGAAQTPVSIDSIRDNYEIAQIIARSRKTAAIIVAGGVPKNYINDAAVMGYLFGVERAHAYAIQVTTAVTQDGGLSGSTLSEARSWGKVQENADFAMAWVEPSVALPLLAGYAFGRRLARGRGRLQFEWDGERLISLSPAAAKRPESAAPHFGRRLSK
jgi:deoxyhypusine synthase